MRSTGFMRGTTALGHDLVAELAERAPKLFERFPNAVFRRTTGLPHDTFLTRWLHNYVVFALQRPRFYQLGIPFLILPIRV